MIRRWLFHAFTLVFSWVFGTRLARAIWRIPGSRGLYQWLMGRLRPDEVTVRGHKIRLDPLDSLLLSVNGTYEENELDLFRDCIRPGDTVIDVGGHIGLYTLEAARAAGPQGQVIAFEPSSANFDILAHNVTANGCSNVTLVRAAVSNSDGESTLVLSSHNSGDHQLATGSDSGAHTEVIQATSIDTYCETAAITKVAVIKMDIQGAEPIALAGARRTVAASADLILFTEVSPTHLALRGGTAAYLHALETAGFTVFQLEGNSIVERSPDELRHLRLSSDTDHADLVCVKGSGARARLDEAVALQQMYRDADSR